MKRNLYNIMKNKFITKFIASNNYILVLLILSPLLIYIAFGTTFYAVHNNTSKHFGLPKDDSYEFYQYNGTPISKGKLREITNPNSLERNISDKSQYLFREALFDSLGTASEMSFLIGSAIAALIWGYMIEEGSIVYQIFNKKSRENAFVEIFSYPLSFVFFISIISSFAITQEIIRIYPAKSIFCIFSISVIILSGAMFFGYIISGIISLISKNTFIPIFVSLLIIGSGLIYPEKKALIIPFEYILLKMKFGLPIEYISLIGIGIMGLCIVGFYVLFKRGSYY